jgi:hypothetical protein
VLNTHDLRRISESRDNCVPQPFRRRSPAKAQRLMKPIPGALKQAGKPAAPIPDRVQKRKRRGASLGFAPRLPSW